MAERRFLGGVLCRDAATRAPVEAPLRLSASGARFFKNRRGIFVITTADGLEEHVDGFEAPPSAPAPEALEFRVSVEDPSGAYIPRQFALRLPRLSPGEPVVVQLFRSPRAEVSPNWAIVHGRLVDAAGAALPAAVVRLVRDRDGELLAISQSVPELGAGALTPLSARTQGEIAIPLVGIPVTLWGEDDAASVLVSDVAVTLEVVPVVGSGGLIDPDDHVATPALPENRWPLNVASGRDVNAGTLSVTLP